MNQKWDWVPNTRLGPVFLRAPVNDYIERFSLKKENMRWSKFDWVVYRFPNIDTIINVEDNMVSSISSYEYFEYKGFNLIGLNINTVKNLIDAVPDESSDAVEYEDGSVQTPYEYDDLGLLIWTENYVVVSACCSEVDDL